MWGCLLKVGCYFGGVVITPEEKLNMEMNIRDSGCNERWSEMEKSLDWINMWDVDMRMLFVKNATG